MDLILIQQLLPPDGGPIYTETNLNAIVAEPWNALSSLAILMPGIYWAFRLKWQFGKFGFIYGCIPLLILGGLGSTFYHAFRASSFLLFLDVLPAAILTLIIGIYFWLKVLPAKWQVATVVVPILLIRFFLFEVLDEETAVNLGYFVAGAMIFIPILIFESRHNFRYFRLIMVSIIFLSASLLMRELDQFTADLLPMGTHFLWHILSGIGAYYLALFLYKLRLEELEAE